MMQFSILAIISLASAALAAPASDSLLEKRCDCTNIVGNSWGCSDPLGAGWNYCQRYYNNAYYVRLHSR
jgi:hypothetical protein